MAPWVEVRHRAWPAEAAARRPTEVSAPPTSPTSPTSNVRIDSELVERDTSPTSETHMTWFGSVSSDKFPGRGAVCRPAFDQPDLCIALVRSVSFVSFGLE